MKRISDILLTSIAPVIWGSTYLVTTELLPDGYPLTASLLRALPAGLILLALSRHLPTGRWWIKVFILGALNFSIFWWLLFVAAYRLPGGLAATVTSIQPLIVLMLAKLILSNSIKPASVVAAIMGMTGVAIVILTPQAEIDVIGVVAALGSALSMAAGTVLSRLWQPSVSLTTFTAWQLTAGGILLLPIALWFEPALPALTLNNVLGFTYLSLIGAALTYLFWFRGIARLGPSGVTPLGFLSPITAIVLGWLFLSQNLNPVQVAGILIVFTSIWLNQRATLSSAQTNKRRDR
ncbi:MAG: EamA family transporter [Desulfuromusa sp.]|jgi:probable blue pigment (indigoidine) exporter|nr:EamA family transporter [Desulfuromusa sp.]